MPDPHFSVTEVINFKRCRRKHDIESLNRRSLTPKLPAPALELGTIMHKGLELWGLHPDKHLSALVEYEGTASLAQTIAAIPDLDDEYPDFMAAQRALVELAKAMGENYQKKYQTPLPEMFDLVALELEVRIPLVENWQPNQYTAPVTIWLEGTLDKLVRHKKSGNLAILDHKTYGSKPDLYALQTDEQFLLYLLIGRTLDIGPVVEVFYDGMWKRPEPPKGRIFDDLFLRTTIMRSEAEIEEARYFTASVVKDMANSNTVMYTNRRWGGCTDCHVKKLCDSMSNGEDTDYIIDTLFMKRQDRKDKRLDG